MFSMLSKRRFQKHDDGLGSHFFQQRVPSSLLFFSKKNLRKMNWNVVFESFSITFGKTGKMDHFQVLMNRHLFSNGKQNKLPKWRQNTWISCFNTVLPTFEIFLPKSDNFSILFTTFITFPKINFWSLKNFECKKFYSKLATLQRLELFT